MKKIWTACICSVISICCYSQSSLYIGAGAKVVLSAGTAMNVDGFAITPSVDYTITGVNSVTRDAVIAPGTLTSHINRVYHFAVSLPAFTGSIRHYYTDAELNGLNENALNLDLYNGSSWTLYPAALRDNVNNFVTTTGLANVSFNEATLSETVLLPVTLTNVKAYMKKGGVQIEWRAEQELNIEKYDVQRSQSAIQFNTIGTVAAIGNGAAFIDYSLFDATPGRGINYYRIKITDKAGRVSYSRVMQINIASDQPFVAVYPNPVSGNTISLQLNNVPKGNYMISIANEKGQTVAMKQINHAGGFAVQAVDLPKALAAGIYTLKITGEGISITEKVIKNK